MPRAKKRQRLNPNPPDTAPAPTAEHDKHARFTTWALSQGISLSGVAPRPLPGRGYGLVATRRLSSGSVLFHVPGAAMLRPPSPPTSLSPQAQLTSHLLSLAASSSPQYEMCASVWPSAASFRASLAWFCPADRNLEYKQLFPRSLAKAYERLVADAKGDREALGREEGDEEFWYAWAVANTRSFSWKGEGKMGGGMVLCPGLDYMNHCAMGQGCEVKVAKGGYTLVANRDYDEGEEILATYGAHSNDKLLAHYGFTMLDSSDDSISLDEIILADENTTLEQRQTLESVGYLGNYSLTPSTNEICFRTQVALRTRLLTSNEWEFFMGSGEDITNDKSDEVRQSLCEMIMGYMPIIAEKVKKLEEVKDEGKGNRDVLSSILERWGQIQDALQKYIDAIST